MSWVLGFPAVELLVSSPGITADGAETPTKSGVWKVEMV